jgi:hypothetical protein
MKDTETKLVISDAATSKLPSKTMFEDTIGHVFIGRSPYGEDLLVITTVPEAVVMFVVLHPQSSSGMCYEYQDLDPAHYRPVSDITYNVKAAG